MTPSEPALIKRYRAHIDNVLKGVFLVLLDLSCAFDTVDHGILLKRMEKEIGLRGTALQWLRSYFTNRTSRVRIGNALSTEHVMLYGLPQGSTVGPLSFTAYTIPLGRIIAKYGLSYHMYTDDLQLYISFDPSNPEGSCNSHSVHQRDPIMDGCQYAQVEQ